MEGRLLKAATVVLLLVLVAFGCGGGDDSAVTTSSLSKAQFIKQANAICEQADEDQFAGMAKVEKEVSGNIESQANEEEMVISGALPPIQREAEEIAALGAPSGDEEDVEALVVAIEGAVEEAEEDPIQGLEKAFNEPDRLAAKYGFKRSGCGETL